MVSHMELNCHTIMAFPSSWSPPASTACTGKVVELKCKTHRNYKKESFFRFYLLSPSSPSSSTILLTLYISFWDRKIFVNNIKNLFCRYVFTYLKELRGMGEEREMWQSNDIFCLLIHSPDGHGCQSSGSDWRQQSGASSTWLTKAQAREPSSSTFSRLSGSFTELA